MTAHRFFRIPCAAVAPLFAWLAFAAAFVSFAEAQQPARKQVIPHHQDKPPGPPLSPQEAVKKMVTPEGFSVEIVASEPDIVNPVAMTFDERGRIWITESLEYPRRSAGPGRDRIKVLEDTTGDGRADKVSVFAEGFNIPSGIAVGHGGVWVANSPDILFLQDTDGDGRADRREVVVTGFGRTDTHELPNSLTWGPDGWLYGLNGVFNHSHVKYRGQEYRFTCALFRIHPKTREFELFAEGTSNPWGVAWDNEGSAFLSACVIDHLWHLTETGYYHRQGGPYPPFTWKIGSIVKHRHQKAAYCGIHYFDSDAYPPEYRRRLYMGNIHGGCVNVDVLQRDGSTYFAKPAPDFLTANDAWFMPVVQKTGPDGCLYVLDWYDRYHCYQDANRDPQGIDRLKGRLYRVRYQDTPRVWNFDLAKLSDEQLIAKLGGPNDYVRSTAQRVLSERAHPAARELLEALADDANASRETRLRAVFTLIGARQLQPEFHLRLLKHKDAGFRAWGVRAAGNMRNSGSRLDPRVRDAARRLAGDDSPDVRLQVAAASRKIEGWNALETLADVLAHGGDDPLIPHIVWQNLSPLLEKQGLEFLALVREHGIADRPEFKRMAPSLVERLLVVSRQQPEIVAALYETLRGADDPAPARACLAAIGAMVQSREIKDERLASLRSALGPGVAQTLQAGADDPLYLDAALLAASWGDQAGTAAARTVFSSPSQPDARRLQALAALIASADKALFNGVSGVLANRDRASAAFRGQVIASLGRLNDPRVAETVLANYKTLEEDLQPKAIELLTQRPQWTKPLLEAIGKKRIPASAVNVNQIRRIVTTGDDALKSLVAKTWGTIRTERNPQRERVVADMRQFIRQHPGDAQRGVLVYKKVCGQCHKMYGEGQEVGPDITTNGRALFAQLLSNVFDPSLVIGAAYQARTVVTSDGRALTGLLVEDSQERVVLKMQGGKLETIAREDVEQMAVSRLSMMPEGLEKQLKPEELADLFSYLTLDKPPSDPKARRMAEVYEQPR